MISRSEEQTYQTAKELAQSLQFPAHILLYGELGAGKTLFAKGLADGFGVQDVDAVSSPTFTLVNQYSGRVRIYHVDLYRIETGALRLVTTDEYDLCGAGRGDTYLRVGEAVAFVNETGKAVGFTAMGPGLLGTDVFLACVYAVYMYTVLRLRMTQEFNRIVLAFLGEGKAVQAGPR